MRGIYIHKTDGSHGVRPMLLMDYCATLMGVEHHYYPIKINGKFKNIFGVLTLFWNCLCIFYKYYRKRDIILVFDDFSYLPAMGILAIFRPVVYNRQELPNLILQVRISKYLPDYMGGRFLLRLINSIEVFLCKCFLLVVTIPLSDDEKDHTRKLGKCQIVLPNYYSRSREKEIIPTHQATGSKLLKFIYSGLICEQNGLAVILHWASYLKRKKVNFEIVLCGYSDFHSDELTEKIRQAGLEDCVKFIGHVSTAQLGSLLERFDFGLAVASNEFYKYASMRDGCSRKLYTYLNYGLPSLCFGKFGEDIARSGVGIHSSEINFDLWYDYICNFTTSGIAYTSFVQRAEIARSGKFNLDHYAKPFLQILNQRNHD